MKTAAIYFMDGTRLELWRGEDLSQTIFVDGTGWQTSYWWSTYELALGQYTATRDQAKRAGSLKEEEEVYEKA